MEVEEIAARFSEYLTSAITLGLTQEINQLNQAAEHEGLCASHLHGDTTYLMLLAFVQTTGRKYDPKSKDDFMVINTAWQVAKERGFYVGGGGA